MYYIITTCVSQAYFANCLTFCDHYLRVATVSKRLL